MGLTKEGHEALQAVLVLLKAMAELAVFFLLGGLCGALIELALAGA